MHDLRFDNNLGMLDTGCTNINFTGAQCLLKLRGRFIVLASLFPHMQKKIMHRTCFLLRVAEVSRFKITVSRLAASYGFVPKGEIVLLRVVSISRTFGISDSSESLYLCT